MRIFPIIGLTICLILAACGADQPIESKQDQKPSLSAPEAATEKPVRKTEEIANGLKVLEKQTPIHVRYDRVRSVRRGIKQHQILVEVLGASPEEVAEQAATAFQECGFDVRKGLNDENGIRYQYLKSGMKPINVRIRSRDAGPKLKDPKATASLYLRQSLN